MKKILTVFFLLCLSLPCFAAAGYNPKSDYYDEVNNYDIMYGICTRAYNVKYDAQKKLFIIPADKKRYAVNIVFTKTGRVIKFNDKVIEYKNGRISKIGNDYVTYLNEKLYTIGGKKIEYYKGYIAKIGDKTLHDYFIKEFTQYEAIKSRGDSCRGPGMSFMLISYGTDFSAAFSDVSIYFDGVPVSDGNKTKAKDNSVKNSQLSDDKKQEKRDERVYYGANGKIDQIGDRRVYYGANGKINQIGNERVYYGANGKIDQIGDKRVYYGADGKMNQIGHERVYYGANGKMNQIGDKRVYYGADGRINQIGN